MSEREPVERLRLFVPCTSMPEQLPVPFDWVENPRDGSFAAAFAFGTVRKSGLDAIETAPGALVLYCPFDLASGRKEALELIKSLPGAIAVRVEQSKLGWERDRWLELIGDANPSSWHRAVVMMLAGRKDVSSCGMHAFSLPDSRVETASEPTAMQALLTTFNVYQLAEDPLLLSGQTFSPARGVPGRTVERWPDLGYPQSSPCHNPYGVWRLGAAGGSARPQRELTPVFMPSLVATLAAMEKKNGQALTRAQVEKIRDECPCIAMKPRDAQVFERERGYADLDPHFAWEQWQEFRATRA